MKSAIMDRAVVEAILAYDQSLIFVKDRESHIVYANDAFLQIYAPDERDSVIGTTTTERFAPDEAELFIAEDRRAFESGDTEIVEEITDWRGKRRTLCTRKRVITTSSGEELLLAIAADISELKGREKALTKSNRQLRDYARSVAHDLRTPIASIISGVSIIQRDKNTSLSDRATMVSDAIKESAHGLSKLLTSMLDAAQSDRKGLTFEKSDLNLLLEEVRFNLSALIATQDATLHTSRLPVAVVEPNLFRQMLQGLIENAIRHSGVDRPVVKLRYRQENGELVFSVADNGEGIPKEKRGLLMKPFTQIEQGKKDGYGLGLVQCQRIAQLHEGFVEIGEAEPEMGGAMVSVHISEDLKAG